MPNYSEAQWQAIYNAWWQTKFSQGKWIGFVVTRLAEGKPMFTTFGESAQTVALALQVAPLADERGDYRVSVAGWNVYDGLVTKLNEAGYRCLALDAPLALTAAPKPAKRRVRK